LTRENLPVLRRLSVAMTVVLMAAAVFVGVGLLWVGAGVRPALIGALMIFPGLVPFVVFLGVAGPWVVVAAHCPESRQARARGRAAPVVMAVPVLVLAGTVTLLGYPLTWAMGSAAAQWVMWGLFLWLAFRRARRDAVARRWSSAVAALDTRAARKFRELRAGRARPLYQWVMRPGRPAVRVVPPDVDASSKLD
jgi:hypothetical protein